MKKALTWVLLAIAFVPLIYSDVALFPSMSTKTLFLRGIVFIASCLFTWLLISNRTYRDTAIAKVKQVTRNPIAISVLASFAILGLSTIFAFDRHVAFLGNVERGEGFVGLAILIVIFFLTSIVFEKKEWRIFLQLSIVSGWILFIGEIVQKLQGVDRPDFLVGNPIFLAAYFLFVIFAACRIYSEGKKTDNGFTKFVGISSICISVVGVLITQTRGVMLGIGAGLLVALAYISLRFRKEGTEGKRFSKRAAVFLVIVLFLGGVFASTRHASFWQHVPGLDRVAQISSTDATTRARFINFQIALDSVSPKHESLHRVVLGWGWDNYTYAWEKYYIPSIYAYDKAMFDRAHDKLLDMLVMNGALGLIAYLAVWCTLFYALFKIGRRDPWFAVVGLFWGVAFFVQDLSAFDALVTYVCFYAVLSLTLYESRN